MFGFLKKEQGPVRVGAATPSAEAAAAPRAVPAAPLAQVLPIQRPGTVPAEPQTSSELEVIASRNLIPNYTSILTASVGRNVMRLSKDQEYAIMALEVGTSKAAIFYDATWPQKEITALREALRVNLVAASYDIDSDDRATDPDLLRNLITDYVSRTDGADESNSRSAAKTLWNRWANLAWTQGASDLHIKLEGHQALVTIRVDGTLEALPDANGGVYTASQALAAVAWAFSDATQSQSNSASIYNPSSQIYAMFKPRVIDNAKVAMRFQNLPGAYGPKIICRLLPVDTDKPTLTFTQLGYERTQIQDFETAADTPIGLVLFAGVTGSGKTTTGKTFMETHPGNGSTALYAMDEPVEYKLRGVHQIAVQRDLSDPDSSKKVFEEIMAGLVRADPDGVSVGEIRDRATGGAIQHIVETGHWGMATTHANFISGIFPRLTDESIGMSREVLTSANFINMLIYQALVPVLCSCKISAADTAELVNVHFNNSPDEEKRMAVLNDMLSLIETKFLIKREHFNFRRQGGCSKCNCRGTKGSTVVAETLLPDETWLDFMRHSRDSEALSYFRSQSDRDFLSDNMAGKTVFEHALLKASRGLIDPRVCQSFNTFRKFTVLPQKATQ